MPGGTGTAGGASAASGAAPYKPTTRGTIDAYLRGTFVRPTYVLDFDGLGLHEDTATKRLRFGQRVFNVVDFGAKGDVTVDANDVMTGGTSDLAAFQAAFNAALAADGGIVLIPAAPGGEGYYLEGEIDYVPGVPGLNNALIVQGSGAQSVLFVKGTSGQYTFSFRNCWAPEFRDLVIRGKLPNGSVANPYGHSYTDIGGVFGGRSVRATFVNCWFLGLDTTRGVIVDSSVVTDRCFFGGCRSGSYGVVNLVQWEMAYLRLCEFQDYGYFSGTNFSKPGSGAYLFLQDPGAGAAPQPGTQRCSVTIDRCSFDEDGAVLIQCKPEGPGPDGASSAPTGVIDLFRIHGTGFNSSGGTAGQICIRAKQVTTLEIDQCAFGWSDGARTIIELQSVRRTEMKHVVARPGTANPNYAPKITADSSCGVVKMIDSVGRNDGPIQLDSAAARTVVIHDEKRCEYVTNNAGATLVVGDVVQRDSGADDSAIAATADCDAPLVVAYLVTTGAVGQKVLVTEPRSGSRLLVNADNDVARKDILTAAGGGVLAKVNNAQTDPDKILARALRARTGAGPVLCEVL